MRHGEKFMLLRIWFLLLLFLLCVDNAWSNEYIKKQCNFLIEPVRDSHCDILGGGYPYWYSVGQAYTESSCKWIVSKDGHGSVGYFQLTPKFLDPVLRSPFPSYTVPNHPHHFYAIAYFMRILHEQRNPTDRLWITFQVYNGGIWVIRECSRADSWEWEDCKKQCRRKYVCVRKIDGECVQYRSACDINYNYSKNIYKYGQLFRPIDEIDEWRFW